MTACEMHVRNPGVHSPAGEYRPCKRRGRYLLTDRHGERWLFCRQHFDAAQRAEM